MILETRISAVPGHEVRLLDDGKKITGMAALYNSPSEDLGGFREIIEPGAFRSAFTGTSDVLARYNHEALLGRTSAKTLRLFDDPMGLRYEVDVPDTTVGRDLVAQIRAGNITGSSFCFRLAPMGGDDWPPVPPGSTPVRKLKNVELHDVSPVDSPAYPATNGMVGIRSLPQSSQDAAAAAVSHWEGKLRELRLRVEESA